MRSRLIPLVSMGLLAVLAACLGLFVVVQEGVNPARGWPINLPLLGEGIALVLLGVTAAASVIRAVVRGSGFSRLWVAGYVAAALGLTLVSLLFR